ncbi:MAG: TolC family protein [Acidobacteriota bacterium]
MSMRPRWFRRALLGAVVLLPALVGPARLAAATPSVAPAADRPWVPAAGEKPAPLLVPEAGAAASIPAGTQVTLAQVLDLALRNSPVTRETWLAAKAAAAEVGVQRAQYYPTLNAGANLTRVQQAQVGGTFHVRQTTYGPTAEFSFLLFDLGGRRGDLDEAKQALLAADWSHNAAIQDVVLNVQRAYYSYLGSVGLRDSLLGSIKQAEVSVNSAEARRGAGLATIADVLQSRTLLEQERLALAQTEGDMKSIKGALATAVGLPPNIEVEVSTLGALPKDLPELPGLMGSTADMGKLLQTALADRPDLLAERARVNAAAARIAQERSAGLPSLSFDTTANRTFYDHVPGSRPSTNYSAQLALRVPLFTGFETKFKVAKAKAEADLEQARLDQAVQQTMLDVWTSYYKLQTAAQSVASSRALLDSAGQSADVSGGRYKEGVGDILELLTSQSALADARAREIVSRAQWFIALAELQRATGALQLALPGTDDPDNSANPPIPTATEPQAHP